MIKIHKKIERPVVLIRAATGYELSRYERNKLANIEEEAQVNKLEAVKVNGQLLPIDPLTKEVNIELGDLAFKSKVSPDDISLEELFFIKCDLDDAELLNN